MQIQYDRASVPARTIAAATATPATRPGARVLVVVALGSTMTIGAVSFCDWALEHVVFLLDWTENGEDVVVALLLSNSITTRLLPSISGVQVKCWAEMFVKGSSARTLTCPLGMRIWRSNGPVPPVHWNVAGVHKFKDC